jgi:D-alanyl-D-alanine endopeptidase (penicillin-binding protein 7)
MIRFLLVLALCWAGHAAAVSADAYIITDMEGKVLLEKNADEVRAIASISKLVVAQNSVALDPNELITISRSDIRDGKMRSTPLRVGEAYTRKQLTELALVSSDNVAAVALGRTVPENRSAHATIVEPSGLSPDNRSSARRVAELARSLYKTEVAEVSTRPATEVGGRRSTNPLLTKEGWSFYLSKTGFINSSGGCLVVITEIAQKPVTVVILGAKNTKQRWIDLVELRRQLGDRDFFVPVKVVVRKKRK